MILVKSGLLFPSENRVLLICIRGLVFLYETVNIANLTAFADISKKPEAWYATLPRVSVLSSSNFTFF